MGSLAQRGLGATVKFAGNNFAEPTDIGDYGISRGDLDVTSHDSSGNAEEFIAGLINAGELTLTCNLKVGDTAQAAAITACGAGTQNIPLVITLPNTDASTFAGVCHVKSYKIKADLKGIIKISFVLKISRAPLWTV